MANIVNLSPRDYVVERNRAQPIWRSFGEGLEKRTLDFERTAMILLVVLPRTTSLWARLGLSPSSRGLLPSVFGSKGPRRGLNRQKRPTPKPYAIGSPTPWAESRNRQVLNLPKPDRGSETAKTGFIDLSLAFSTRIFDDLNDPLRARELFGKIQPGNGPQDSLAVKPTHFSA